MSPITPDFDLQFHGNAEEEEQHAQGHSTRTEQVSP